MEYKKFLKVITIIENYCKFLQLMTQDEGIKIVKRGKKVGLIILCK